MWTLLESIPLVLPLTGPDAPTKLWGQGKEKCKGVSWVKERPGLLTVPSGIWGVLVAISQWLWLGDHASTQPFGC